ncbi:MAG: hypothetical protein AAGA99_21455 [Actinomycetota bacterium]
MSHRAAAGLLGAAVGSLLVISACSSNPEPALGPLEGTPISIVSAPIWGDRHLVVSSGCRGTVDWSVVESTPDRLRVEVRLVSNTSFLCATTEVIELSEPIGGRLVIDDVTGEVAADGRFWDGQPFVAIDHPSWIVADVSFPPDLATPPSGLDPVRWSVAYDSAGRSTVVQAFTDTAAEVAHASVPEGMIDEAIYRDIAPGWSVRISGLDGHAIGEIARLLEPVDEETWRAHIGVEWGER